MSTQSKGGFDYERDWHAWDPWKPIPERYNLGTALTRGNVERGLGDRTVLFWENSEGDTRQITYAELDTLTNRLASSLAKLGVKRADRVFLRLPNLPEFYVAALATAKLGGVFIPSSTLFREDEIRYRLQDSGAAAVVTTAQLVGPVENVRGDCPELKHVIVVPYRDEKAKGDCLDFDRLVSDGDEHFQAADTANDDIAFLAYTSGTTGEPKGVVHLHRYPIAYEALVRWWHEYRDNDLAACPAEMGWLLPVASTFLYALAHGLSVVLYHPVDGRFDATAWFRLIEKYAITNFTGTPTVYRMLLAAEKEAKAFDLSSLRHGVSAGEPLPADTFSGIVRLLGFEPLDGIGMSECMVYCHNRVGMPVRPGSCGQPSPGTVIELMDENLQPVPAGEPGVLCVRRDTHPGMMLRYWNKPEETDEIFRVARPEPEAGVARSEPGAGVARSERSEGRGETSGRPCSGATPLQGMPPTVWYWSGDVLRRDAEGYYWFEGRADDVIKASGYRISPFEVESCLVSHPAVLEAAAVESPDELRGRVVKAFLVLREGREPSDELAGEIQEYVKQHIAPYKYPRKVEFIAALPKTQSSKIKRGELRAGELGKGK